MGDIKDYFYELEVEPVFENKGIKFRGLCARYRMNLLAVSKRDKNIMFVAMNDTICVYRLGLLDDIPGEPFKILKRPVYSEPSQQDHIINAIKVDKIGNEEVLVSVDGVGDVHIWFTANLDKNPIQFSNNESTWGIALHGPKRLLAVSANSHEITIFNLQKSVQFFNEFDEDDDLDSSDEEEPQTSKTYASVLTKISDNDALGGGRAVSVLQGHEHNVPNISFSACGRFLVSCSIDATCRVWNVKTGELIRTKLLLTGDYDDWNFGDNDEEWGWSANFVPKSAFKTVSSNCEVCRPNSASSPSSTQSMDSLNLYRQHLRYNLDGQGQNLQGAEDLYRIIISRNLRFGSREYEDGYIEDGAYFESDYDTEEGSNEDDPELESNEDDTEEESNNSFIVEDEETSFHPSRHFPNRERSVMEIEGNATPAYYDRAESATPVVENYTENNPDYRWSVGHELGILNSNNEQNDENDSSSVSEGEIEKDHDEESPEEITEEMASQPAQSNACTAHGYSSSSPTYSSVQPSYSPRSIVSLPQTISEDITPAPSHSNNPNFLPETSGNQNNVNFLPDYSPVPFTGSPLVHYSSRFSSFSSTNPRYAPTSPSYSPVSPQFTPFSPQYVPTSPQYSSTSPHYSPTSPHYTPTSQYSPTSPQYLPTFSQHVPSLRFNSIPSPSYVYTSPQYAMTSPQYSPTSPHYSPTSPLHLSTTLQYSPHDSPNYSPTSPGYSPTSSEHIEHSSRFSTIQPPYSQNSSSSRYSSVSPTYSPVSPEYVPTNQESYPPHSSIVEPITNDLQQESLLPSPNESPSNRREIISQPSSMSTVNTSMGEEHLDVTDDEDIVNSLLSSRRDTNNGTIIDSSSRIPDISNDQNTYDRLHIHHKRIEPLGSSQSDCCPDLGLPDELILYTTKHDLFILDPKSNLKVLCTEKDIVRKVDSRHFTVPNYDRLNMVEVIPELSLIIVASQQGKVALTRLIKIVDDNDDERYILRPENYLPPTQMTSPLLGMFVVKHDTYQEPALLYYRLYLMYCSGIMFCYEIRRKKETNPLRMDNILI